MKNKSFILHNISPFLPMRLIQNIATIAVRKMRCFSKIIFSILCKMLDIFPETIVKYVFHSSGSQPVTHAPHVDHLILSRTKKKTFFSILFAIAAFFCVLLVTWPTPTASPWSVGKLPYLTSVPWRKTVWDRCSIEYVYGLIGATPNLFS